MFTVVHPMNSQTLWAPVNVSETCYVGSIIAVDTATPTSGVRPIPVAAGAANVTNLDIPLGVVVGTNAERGNELFSTTYKTEYITAGAEAAAHDPTTSYRIAEGEWPKGDRWPHVEYIPITSETVIRGPIYNAAYGTAPSVETVSTGSGTDGLDFSTSAADVATVANFNTVCFRTGLNQGIMRILTSASATTHTHTPAFPADVAVGDTCVIINGLRPFGFSYAYIDAEAMYIDASAALTANYLIIDVLRLHLNEAGNEYVEFRFNPVNFLTTDRSDVT